MSQGGERYELRAIGSVESNLRDLGSAPRQPDEGAPPAVIHLRPEVAEAARDIVAGAEILVLTWLHLADRDTLFVEPRDDQRKPLTGVFSTRSQDRPNPIGLHRVKVLRVAGGRIEVDGLEAVDGTPIVDLKPVLDELSER